MARTTNSLGAQKLDDAYGEVGGVRLPDDVRSSADLGDLYAWLVQERRPTTVVEFGSAFGVSGMYFAHPDSRYFTVGKLGRDQVAAYAARKGSAVAEVERWLRPYLAYEPAS